jgi:hypothetical protein
MKVTPWFPCTTPPVRNGIYEFRYKHGGLVLTTLFNGLFNLKRRGLDGSVNWQSSHCLLNDFPYNYEWRGVQGDEHSRQIGANTYLVEFSEGPDRPGDGE